MFAIKNSAWITRITAFSNSYPIAVGVFQGSILPIVYINPFTNPPYIKPCPTCVGLT